MPSLVPPQKPKRKRHLSKQSFHSTNYVVNTHHPLTSKHSKSAGDLNHNVSKDDEYLNPFNNDDLNPFNDDVDDKVHHEIGDTNDSEVNEHITACETCPEKELHEEESRSSTLTATQPLYTSPTPSITTSSTELLHSPHLCKIQHYKNSSTSSSSPEIMMDAASELTSPPHRLVKEKVPVTIEFKVLSTSLHFTSSNSNTQVLCPPDKQKEFCLPDNAVLEPHLSASEAGTEEEFLLAEDSFFSEVSEQSSQLSESDQEFSMRSKDSLLGLSDY